MGFESLRACTQNRCGAGAVAWERFLGRQMLGSQPLGSDPLVVDGELGDVRLHRKDLETLERVARERVTRSLTDVECQKFLGIESCPSA